MRNVKTNELKKGTRILLSNGWEGRLEDNARGNTRIATVYGFCTEMGSVYSHDIVRAWIGDEQVGIEYTPAQLKCKQFADNLFATLN